MLITLLVLFSVSTISAVQPASATITKTIQIASEPDYPPYCLVDENGEAAGFSIDLFRAAAEAAGLGVKIKIGIWSQIKQDLAEGRIDALPLVGRTPEREQLYDFTMPYLSLHGAVFVKKGTTGINALADLKDKRVAVMEGDNAEEFVRRGSISDHIFTTYTFEEAFRGLAAGKYDAVLTQRVMGLNLLSDMGIKSVIPLDVQIPEFRQDFCFAVQKGNTLLLSRLNEGLSIIIANKTFEQIRYQWFGPEDKEKINYREVIRILLSYLIPLLIIIAMVVIILMRKVIRHQTRNLSREISERRKTEIELRQLKNELEETVAQRTAELEEKIQKLDKSEKAMLYMVEDLNSITSELKGERRKLLLSNQELEAFTYSVSHDLRAPLRAIDGYSKFLLEDYSDTLDLEGKRYINVIRQSSGKMDQLITDLLSLSRVSRSDMNLMKIDMKALIEAVYQDTASPEEKKEFTFIIGKLPRATGDPTLLKQVWQNLIGNALKYSSKSSVKQIEIAAEEQESEIIYSIKDHGTGFNDKYKQKLFGVFQRLHSEEEFEGTGVGLAIVKRIIHRHGGQVWAEGRIDEGASFFLSLPRPEKL